MAPLVPPPPVINLDEAKEIEKKFCETNSVTRHSHSLIQNLFTSSSSNEVKKFSGADFVKWAVQEKIAKDEDNAVKIGQALLEHRLAHHVTDDAEFLNDPTSYYAFMVHETIEAKMLHSALSQFVAKPELFHQGKLELRSKSLFGYERWTPVYAVLDEPSAKPRMLHLFKRFSAASAPIESYAIEECVCTLEECLDCKTDWYCFSLKAKKRATGKEVNMVLCANHSKRLEGWLSALMEAGVEFTKEEDGAKSEVRSLFELSARRINSNEVVPFSVFRGKVCLVVNVASK